jgi:hypothetical protein
MLPVRTEPALYVTYTSTFSSGAPPGRFSQGCLGRFGHARPTSMIGNDLGIGCGQIRCAEAAGDERPPDLQDDRVRGSRLAIPVAAAGG